MIWLVGEKGMLSKEIELMLEKNGIKHVGTDKELDITDYAVLAEFSENLDI